MTDIGIDPDGVERSVRTVVRHIDALGGREFVFRDPRGVGSPVTEAFDRAFHTFSWTVAQCVSGSERELLDDADAIADVVGGLSAFDEAVASRVNEARRALEFGAV